MGNSESNNTLYHINVHICGDTKKFKNLILILFPERYNSKQRLFKLELKDLPSKEIIQWNSFTKNGKISKNLIEEIFEEIKSQSYAEVEKRVDKHCIICFNLNEIDEKIIVKQFLILKKKNESLTPFIIFIKYKKEEIANKK